VSIYEAHVMFWLLAMSMHDLYITSDVTVAVSVGECVVVNEF